jgi:hypothetical protein
MAALRFGGRTLAALAMASLGLAAGCYATTPHTAQVASGRTPSQCANVVAEVMARSGFVQVARPPGLSMLFAARTTGPYTSFLTTGAGVGVMLTGDDHGGGSCQVMLQAVSPDVDCADSHTPLACGFGSDMIAVTGESVAVPQGNASGSPPCPIVRPLTCELSYAPGADNDAAVDELARRVRVALGSAATVN